MTCEGKSDFDLNEMSDKELDDAWKYHVARIQKLYEDPEVILEFAEQHVIRARQIEDIIVERSPRPIRDALQTFREQLREWREGS